MREEEFAESIDYYKKEFADHVATLQDYGNIKVLDFKRPSEKESAIRFLFEEDACTLHISGDWGYLIAQNYDNMRYETFSKVLRDIGYFTSKVKVSSRPLYEYKEEEAVKDIEKLFDQYCCAFSSTIEKYEKIADIMSDFDSHTGIGVNGRCELEERLHHGWNIDIGKRGTEILNIYKLAFELATEQLKYLQVESSKKEQENDMER